MASQELILRNNEHLPRNAYEYRAVQKSTFIERALENKVFELRAHAGIGHQQRPFFTRLPHSFSMSALADRHRKMARVNFQRLLCSKQLGFRTLFCMIWGARFLMIIVVI